MKVQRHSLVQAAMICQTAEDHIAVHLNEVIAVAVGWPASDTGVAGGAGLPSFSDSIDAAALLVPRSMSWMLSTTHDGGFNAYVTNKVSHFEGGGFRPNPNRFFGASQGQSAALALCAAALLARAAEEGAAP